MTSARHRQAMSARTNRKARRAAKIQSEAPAVAVLPTPVVASGSGYARYVGRVGALAVALGLGAAVATGYGLGIPAVASAENGSESTDNTPNDPPQDPPAEPSGNGSGSSTATGSTGPTVPEMQLPEHSNSQQTSNTASPSEMQVSVSGGAQLTGSGSGSGTTQSPTTHSQTPTPTQEPLANNGTPSGGTTPSTSQAEPGYVAPTGTTIPAAPQNDPTPNVIPNPSGHVAPELSGTTTTTVVHGSTDPNPPGNGAARLVGGQPNIQTFSTAADLSFTSQMSLATASGTPAPAALVDQPDNPIEALMGAPAALVNIAATAISMFFNGLLNPGPGTPAPPVMLFVVLGWAQRELARTFFNQSPNGVADHIGTNEDTGVNIPVLSNDTDGDLGAGDVLTVTDYTQPFNGSVTLNPNGTFTYTPDANFNGTDTFTYTVSDEASPWHMHGLGGFFFGGAHAAAPTTVTITVGSINDAPVAVDDAFTTDEDHPLTGNANVYLASNDTDVDGDTLTAVSFTQPVNGGSVTNNGDGTWTYTPGTNAQALDDGESLQDSFTYTVSDGALTDTGTVTITVNGVNDAPVAVDDQFTTDEDHSLTGDPNFYLAGNDTDVDLENLTAVSFTQPTNGGSVTNNGDGTWTYTPGTNAQTLGAGESFDDTFTYKVSDGTATDTGLVTITVTGVNDAPITNPDTFTVGEDSVLTGDPNIYLAGNDTDIDGDALTVVGFTQPTNGTVVDNGDGTWTYSANAQDLDDGETRTDTFTYTISDGTTTTDGLVTITITGANDAPVAVDDAFTTDEDTPLTGDPNFYLAGNDTDVDLENLTAVSFTQPTNGGTVVANPDGTWTYTPGTNAQTLGAGGTLTDTFTYEVSDGTATDTGLVTITVTGINDAPAAADDVDDTDEDTATTGNVLTNDTDIDGGPLVVTTTTPMNGTYGTVTINPDGSYTYTPYNGGAPGTGPTVTVGAGEEFTIDPDQVTHGTYDSDFYIDGVKPYVAFVFTPSTTGTYVIEQTNIPTDTTLFIYDGTFDPAAENTNLLSNDDDSGPGVTPRLTVDLVAGHTYTIVNSTWSTGETLDVPLTFTSSGAATITNPGTGSGADALAEGETGTETFTYEISDGNGGTDTATLTITITGTNDAPEATDDSFVTDEDSGVVLDVLSNDTDVDNNDVLSVVSFGQPANGGSVVDNLDGTWTYTPGANAQTLGAGASLTDTFTYTVTDALGATDTGTVTVTVTGLNDAPIANPDAFPVSEDGVLTGDPNIYLAGNDTDIDGDALTVVGFTQPTNGGSVVANPDGTWTYTPNAQDLDDGETRTDTFTYTISDGTTTTDGLVTITITGANDAPVAGADSSTTDEDQSVNVNVLTNDSDIDGDTLTVVGFTQPTNGGSVVDNGDGTFTYTPGANAQELGTGGSLQDTFTYTVSDGTTTALGTVTITVAGSNDAPVAVDDAFSTGEDSPPLTFNLTDLLNNDTDVEGDTLAPFVGSLTQPAHGSLIFDSGTGTFTYTPSAAAQGLDDGEAFTDTFSYTILDGNGGFDTATVTITTIGANDAPVAVDDTFTTDEDTPLTGDPNFYLAGNDTDVDLENLTAVSFTTPTNGGSVVDNGDGTWTYTPGANAQELGVGQSLVDSFDYVVSDGDLTDTGTVTITVHGVNDAPVAADDLAATDEDTATTGNVLTNDTDVDGGPLTVTTTTPMNGTYGTVTINPDGSYTYTPYDGGTVVGAGGGAITLDDPTQAAQGTAVFFGSGDSPRNYIAIAFTPTATQSYLFGQPSGPIDTMLALYDGPFDPASPENWIAFNDDSGGGTCGGYSCPQVTANLTAGQPITIVITTFSAGVLLGLPQNLYTTGPGTFAGSSAGADALAEGETGTDVFTYEVSDGNGGTDTATLTVSITGTNDAPVAADDLGATDEETPVSGNLLSNDSDVDNGDVLTVTTTTPMTGNYGTVTIGTDGSYTYTPGTAAQSLAAGETATDTFTYSITDTHGATDSADLMITLTGINDAPVANPDAFGTDEDHPLTGDPNAFLGINDTDADGDPLTVTGFTQPTNGGIVVDNGNGTWTYNPNAQDLAAGQTRTDTFTYFVSDGTATTEGLVTVTITGLDDAPTLTASQGATTYTENDAPVAVDSGITLTDIDTPTMVAAIISINNAQTGDTLNWTEPTISNIHVQYNDGQQIVLVGNASQAEYQAALQSITFESVGDDPVAGNRTINFTIVTPDAQNTVAKSVTVVAVNDNPVGQPDEYTTEANTPLTVAGPGLLVNDSDPDNAVIKSTIWVNPDPLTGAVVVNNDGSFTFTPAQNFVGTTTFYYAANDGIGGVATPTLVTVHVLPASGPGQVEFDSLSTADLSGTGPQIYYLPDEYGFYGQTFTATSSNLNRIEYAADHVGSQGAGPVEMTVIVASVRYDGSGFHPDMIIFQSALITIDPDGIDDGAKSIRSVDTTGATLVSGQQYVILFDANSGEGPASDGYLTFASNPQDDSESLVFHHTYTQDDSAAFNEGNWYQAQNNDPGSWGGDIAIRLTYGS